MTIPQLIELYICCQLYYETSYTHPCVYIHISVYYIQKFMSNLVVNLEEQNAKMP